MQALQKFYSKPVSSTISFTNGDDKHGNMQFPAITICIINFSSFFEKKLDEYCPSNWIQNYHDIFEYCLEDKLETLTTTEGSTTLNLFGNTYEDYYDNYEKFQSVESLMNFTNIEVYDIIDTFHYGEDIQVMPNAALTDSLRQEYLKQFWIKTYDHEYGPCFTFDPGMQNVSWLQAKQNVAIGFDFKWFDTARYELGFHTSLKDRFDRRARQPLHSIKANKIYNLKLSKTKFESLYQEESQCSSDLFGGPTKCLTLRAGWKVVKKYNCTLPWMQLDFPDVETCDHLKTGNVTRLWVEEFNHEQTSECSEDILPCTRTVYDDSLEELSRFGQAYGHGTGLNTSKLNIQFPNPYVQVIKDSYNYDMQSLIGEVGGTLGLLLGLSFISVFDLIESIINCITK